MRTNTKFFFILLFYFAVFIAFSQNGKGVSNPTIILDPEKVAIFQKYLEFQHGNYPGGFKPWKNDNPELYEKEMWYYTESFYIKRDYLSQGITMDEGMIYVARFETQRAQDDEVIVTFPGFKDVMVLIPASKLIYKPN
jgi:hypothetical protein